MIRRLHVGILAGSLLLVACASRSPVSDAVGRQAQSGKSVVLGEITKFPWDTVYIFGPYHPQERVCTRLPLWRECKEVVAPQGVSEGAFLTVFVYGERAVHHEFHHRAHGEYCQDSCALVLRKDEAVFLPVVAPAEGAERSNIRLSRGAAKTV
jgi:hypothetical protein